MLCCVKSPTTSRDSSPVKNAAKKTEKVLLKSVERGLNDSKMSREFRDEMKRLKRLRRKVEDDDKSSSSLRSTSEKQKSRFRASSSLLSSLPSSSSSSSPRGSPKKNWVKRELRSINKTDFKLIQPLNMEKMSMKQTTNVWNRLTFFESTWFGDG